MLRAVLHEFRRYMTTEQAIAFADILPPIVRAIFEERLSKVETTPEIVSEERFLDNVKTALSPHHVPPDSIVEDVFAVLGDRIGRNRIIRTLNALSPALVDFWRMSSKD